MVRKFQSWNSTGRFFRNYVWNLGLVSERKKTRGPKNNSI